MKLYFWDLLIFCELFGEMINYNFIILNKFVWLYENKTIEWSRNEKTRDWERQLKENKKIKIHRKENFFYLRRSFQKCTKMMKIFQNFQVFLKNSTHFHSIFFPLMNHSNLSTFFLRFFFFFLLLLQKIFTSFSIHHKQYFNHPIN